MLHITDMTLRMGGRVLFDQATVHIPAGSRVGLVGRNGAGKSTLLKLILGEMATDGGEVRLRPRAKLGHLPQEAPDGADSLIDTVLAADVERATLLAELENEPDMDRLGDIHDRLTVLDAYTAPARAATILSGLGFPAHDHDRSLQDYSGGWRMRVALAAALFAHPDLLLLDEPTNHLDLEAGLWLEEHLSAWNGTLIVISHDRGILNRVANRIVHLENKKLVGYGGNYDSFERERRQKMDLAVKGLAKQVEQRARLQGFVDRFKATASKARQAQSRVKMLERMGPLVSVIEDRPVTLEFPDPEPLPPPLYTTDAVSVGYDERVILSGLDFRIDPDDRIALLGANGNGKSTLARLLTGRLQTMKGVLRKSARLRVGYFAQHQMEELDFTATPFALMARAMPGANETKVRSHLGRFSFGADHINTKVGDLSGGEKARLLIALMTKEEPHLLVLDEPTNHLDIDSREALVAALTMFSGAVILISHDPHLVEMVADRLWLVGDGRVTAFDGDMDDYRQLLLDRGREARRDSKMSQATANSSDKAGGKPSKEDRKAASEARTRLAPLKKAADTAEKTVQGLNARKAVLEAELAAPKLYNGPPGPVAAKRKELAEVDRDLDTAEVGWIAALEAVEAAERGE